MKLTHFLAAGLLFAGIGISTEASAQRHDRHGQQYRGDRHDARWDRRDDRRWDRGDRRRWDSRRGHRWDRHDRGRHHGWRNHGRRDCRVVYRYGQRQRICR